MIGLAQHCNYTFEHVLQRGNGTHAAELLASRCLSTGNSHALSHRQTHTITPDSHRPIDQFDKHFWYAIFYSGYLYRIIVQVLRFVQFSYGRSNETITVKKQFDRKAIDRFENGRTFGHNETNRHSASRRVQRFIATSVHSTNFIRRHYQMT